MLKLHLHQLVALVFLSTFALFSIAQDSQSTESDILFLKIQELEMEIADLRNEVEAQNYLIEKLINESLKEEKKELVETEEASSILGDDVYRFDGINDAKSIDEIYNEAVRSLANEDYDAAKKLFNYLINNFSDPDKLPLSLFWLAEIEFSSSNFEASKNYYMQLISSFENHWRVPLAHKKIGDISFKLGNIKMAKQKYQFVIREFPNNPASSMSLQSLEDME
jgi:TolA-binding protein|tara:strand:+ start:447 stop:1115 length:669 start_codon:yes stop_codon:yes gene_type:complete